MWWLSRACADSLKTAAHSRNCTLASTPTSLNMAWMASVISPSLG